MPNIKSERYKPGVRLLIFAALARGQTMTAQQLAGRIGYSARATASQLSSLLKSGVIYAEKDPDEICNFKTRRYGLVRVEPTHGEQSSGGDQRRAGGGLASPAGSEGT